MLLTFPMSAMKAERNEEGLPVKKFWALIFVLIMALGIAGCANAPASEPAIYDTGRVTDDNGDIQYYTIKGLWQFNEILTEPENGELTESDIVFEIEAPAFHWMQGMLSINQITVSANGSAVTYLRDKENLLVYRYYPANKDSNGWECYVYRNIDFGEEPQMVSKDFYEWFIVNASPATE